MSRLDSAAGRFRPVVRLPEDASDHQRLLEARDGTLWIGTSDGIYRVDPAAGTAEHHDLDTTGTAALSNHVLALYQDWAGAVWAGTRSGIYRYDPHEKPFVYLGRHSGLPRVPGGTTVTDPLGTTEQHTHDASGRLAAASDPAGRRSSVTNRAGETTNSRGFAFVDGAGTTTEPQSYRFVDDDLPFEADTLRYRLKQVDYDGNVEYSPEVEVNVGTPEAFALHGNFPTPFAAATTIRYELPEARRVRLVVFDVLGRHVATLVDEEQAAGRYQARFEVRHRPAGVYLYRLQAGDFTAFRRMVLVD